jgi:hypothetical protein
MARTSFLVRWRDAVLSPSGLSPRARLVACALAKHMNKDGDSCWPSVALLASECGYPKRLHVQRALAELEKAGFIAREGKGGHAKANRYWALIPGETGTQSAPVTDPATGANSVSVTASTTGTDSATTGTKNEDLLVPKRTLTGAKTVPRGRPEDVHIGRPIEDASEPSEENVPKREDAVRTSRQQEAQRNATELRRDGKVDGNVDGNAQLNEDESRRALYAWRDNGDSPPGETALRRLEKYAKDLDTTWADEVQLYYDGDISPDKITYTDALPILQRLKELEPRRGA